uniref:Uncharacterized protein n=1 Tax=Arundo donax TaxID=35708 RepID=A0A0A8Y707_ARUDO
MLSFFVNDDSSVLDCYVIFYDSYRVPCFLYYGMLGQSQWRVSFCCFQECHANK